MKKFLLSITFSIAALCGISQKVERVEVGNRFTYTITQYSDGSSFTNAYQKESLLYKKGLAYNDCFFEGDMVELKSILLASIKSRIPNIELKLRKNSITMYVVLLPNIQGKIEDAYVGWNSNCSSLFSEKELQNIILATKSPTLKVRSNSKNSKLKYCDPLTISFFPNK